MAPSYANIFISRLERQLLQSVILKPFSWLRFIDDIDMKWTHGRETLEAFLKTANSFHPIIRFTAEVSNDKHVFLDTMSHLADGKVAVDLYTKPRVTVDRLVQFCKRFYDYFLTFKVAFLFAQAKLIDPSSLVC